MFICIDLRGLISRRCSTFPERITGTTFFRLPRKCPEPKRSKLGSNPSRKIGMISIFERMVKKIRCDAMSLIFKWKEANVDMKSEGLTFSSLPLTFWLTHTQSHTLAHTSERTYAHTLSNSGFHVFCTKKYLTISVTFLSTILSFLRSLTRVISNNQALIVHLYYIHTNPNISCT